MMFNQNMMECNLSLLLVKIFQLALPSVLCTMPRSWLYTYLHRFRHRLDILPVWWLFIWIHLNLFRFIWIIWTTSINDHQYAVPCAACHFMLLHSSPASNPRLVDFQAYLYNAKDAVAWKQRSSTSHSHLGCQWAAAWQLLESSSRGQ